MKDYHSIHTYRDLHEALQASSDEQLNRPVQCVDSHPVDESDIKTKDALTIFRDRMEPIYPDDYHVLQPHSDGTSPNHTASAAGRSSLPSAKQRRKTKNSQSSFAFMMPDTFNSDAKHQLDGPNGNTSPIFLDRRMGDSRMNETRQFVCPTFGCQNAITCERPHRHR